MSTDLDGMPPLRRTLILIALLVASTLAAGPASAGAASTPSGTVELGPATVLRTSDVFVSPTGSDAGDGSLTHPYRSIAQGLSAARPGTTVYLRGGSYTEQVRNPRLSAGTPDRPVTVRNYPNERPVLRGLLWLKGASYWHLDGLSVTWSAANASSEHMVKLTDGTGWSVSRSELWGAHTYAALLIVGNASNWVVSDNYIHDTVASNGTNQDHLIYVNSRGHDGLIEGNTLTNSGNGRAVKVGPSSANAGTVSGVTIRYNTMSDNTGPSNVQLAWGTSQVAIYRNTMIRPAAGRSAVTAYQLTGRGNTVHDNLVVEAVRAVDTGVPGLVDGGGNVMAATGDARYGAGAQPGS